MEPFYAFREEEKSRFGIFGSSAIALFLMVLLLLWVQRSALFHLDAAEMARLQEIMAEQEEQDKDMVFRFIDTPAETEKNPEATFLSDADRVKKSQQEEEEPPENQDPISRGDTYELKQDIPQPPVQAAEVVPPSPAVEQASQPPTPNQTPDEPDEPEQPQEEDTPPEPMEEGRDQPSRDDLKGKVPLDPGAPKPYRKLSEDELALAAREASSDMRLLEQRQQRASPSQRQVHRYENPRGSSAPRMGFDIDTAGHDLGPYLKILQQLVRGNWRIPSIARLEVSGVNVVSFKLHQDGRITDAVLMVDSEYEPLDTSSLNAIINTHQAPPLPQHIDEPWIPIKFAFYYNVRPSYR